MTVLQDLFSLQSISYADGLCQASLLPRTESAIYCAHFPGSPITPGACLVQAVGEILAQATGVPQHLVTVKNVKFVNMIVPGDNHPVDFQIQYTPADGRAKVVVSKDGEIYSKMSLVFAL